MRLPFFNWLKLHGKRDLRVWFGAAQSRLSVLSERVCAGVNKARQLALCCNCSADWWRKPSASMDADSLLLKNLANLLLPVFPNWFCLNGLSVGSECAQITSRQIDAIGKLKYLYTLAHIHTHGGMHPSVHETLHSLRVVFALHYLFRLIGYFLVLLFSSRLAR